MQTDNGPIILTVAWSYLNLAKINLWLLCDLFNKGSFITLVIRAGVTGRGTSCVSCASWWISPRWPSRCWRPCWGWCSAPAASQQMSFSLKTQWRWEIFRDCFLKPNLKDTLGSRVFSPTMPGWRLALSLLVTVSLFLSITIPRSLAVVWDLERTPASVSSSASPLKQDQKSLDSNLIIRESDLKF